MTEDNISVYVHTEHSHTSRFNCSRHHRLHLLLDWSLQQLMMEQPFVSAAAAAAAELPAASGSTAAAQAELAPTWPMSGFKDKALA